MKRTHYDAFPRRSPRLKQQRDDAVALLEQKRKDMSEGPCSLLPREIIMEILKWLMPGADYREYSNASFEKRHAVNAVRTLNVLWGEILLEVVRGTWRAAYMTVKKDCAEHDWDFSHPLLGSHLFSLDSTFHFFEHVYPCKSQLGWLNSPLLAHVNPKDANAVIDCISTDYSNRRERARTIWFKTSSVNHTFAQLLWFVQPYIERNLLLPIFNVMIPPWVQLDLDDCLVHLLLWMEIHSALWEEIRYFRNAFVTTVLEYKLNIKNLKLVQQIREDWMPMIWSDQYIQQALMDHWMAREPLERSAEFWTLAGKDDAEEKEYY